MNSLYEVLGKKVINDLVEEFYARVFVSDLIKDLFKTDREVVKDKQRKFLTQFFGGPTNYTEEYRTSKNA